MEKKLQILIGGTKNQHEERYTLMKVYRDSGSDVEKVTIPLFLEEMDGKLNLLCETTETDGSVSKGKVGEIIEEDGYATQTDVLKEIQTFGKESMQVRLAALDNTLKYIIEVKFEGETVSEKQFKKLEGKIADTSIQGKQKWIEDTELSEKAIKAALGMINVEGRKRRPSTGVFKFKNSSNIIERTIVNYIEGRPMLFVGPKASGKNTLAEDIAEFFEVDIFEQQIHPGVDETQMLGQQVFVEEGKMEFKPSPLIQAMENGGILVLDEVNTAHASLMALLHSILDTRKRIDVPGYGLVEAHPQFRVIATMNEGYTGTFQLNPAFKSRFALFSFEESTKISEIVKMEVPETEKKTLDIMEKIYKAIQRSTRAVESADYVDPESKTVRGFIAAAGEVKWGISLKQALIENVANYASDEDDRTSIINLISLHVED